MHSTFHNGGAGIWLRSVPALSRPEEKVMAIEDNDRSDAARGKCICHLDVFERDSATHEVVVRGDWSNFSPQRLATVLEAIAQKLRFAS